MKPAPTILVAVLGLAVLGASTAQRSAAPADATIRTVAAARAFLATLDAGQRAKANIELNAKTRTIWSNLPSGATLQTGATERNGLKLADMTPAQEKAALALVSATLSKEGFQKAMAIVDADQTLELRSAPTRPANSRYAIRAWRILCGDPWRSVGDRHVDDAVRRPSPGHQRHDRGTRKRAHAHAHRRAAGKLHASRAGRSGRSATRTTRRLRCSTR